jgi:hypothetical protein
MDDNRLAKIAKNGKPNTIRRSGRPPTRCCESWTSTPWEEQNTGHGPIIRGRRRRRRRRRRRKEESGICLFPLLFFVRLAKQE